MVNKDDYIQQFGLLEILEPRLINCVDLLTVEPGHEICSQSFEQSHLYFLVSGSVQVNFSHQNGKNSILAILSPLTIIGDLEIFSFDIIKTNVVSIEESELLYINKPDVVKYGFDNSIFLRFIIQNLTQKLHQTSILQMGNIQTLQFRLALYLLENTTHNNNIIHIPQRAHLASLLGTTVRHLNRTLKDLVKEQIIMVSYRQVEVLNRPALKDIVE